MGSSEVGLLAFALYRPCSIGVGTLFDKSHCSEISQARIVDADQTHSNPEVKLPHEGLSRTIIERARDAQEGRAVDSDG